jgi:hypothetical protein
MPGENRKNGNKDDRGIFLNYPATADNGIFLLAIQMDYFSLNLYNI